MPPSSASIVTLLLMLIMSTSSMAEQNKTINVYTYHDKPPYVIYDSDITHINAGIYLELIQQLNQESDSQQFQLIYMPRVRLELLLQDKKLDGIIIGVNPLWFGDKEKQRYLWSEPFMVDKDIFLVNTGRNLNITQNSDLSGLTIALERGTYYKGITELINNNKITLAATNSSEQNLNMLAYNRADITIISQLTANYFFNNGYQKSLFKILNQPHDIFQRFILIPQSMGHLTAPIDKAIIALNKTNNWLVQFDEWLALEGPIKKY